MENMRCKLLSNGLKFPLIGFGTFGIAQIILRWDIQRGIIPIPKSKSFLRISENCDIFDFELSNEDMQRIYSLDENFKIYVESLFCPSYSR